MMVKGACSNPTCHRPYTSENYVEAILLLRCHGVDLEYRVFSVCRTCLKDMNDAMVEATMRDVIDFEVAEKSSSPVISSAEKNSFRERYTDYKIVAWGKTRDELDTKITDPIIT